MSKTKQITIKEKTKRNSAEDIFVAYKKTQTNSSLNLRELSHSTT